MPANRRLLSGTARAHRRQHTNDMAKKRKREPHGLKLVMPDDKNAVPLLRAFVDYPGDDFRFEQHVNEDDFEFIQSIYEKSQVEGFVPTQRQIARAARVVDDLNRSAARERFYQKIANKPPSNKPEWIARRAAKLRVWEGRLSFNNKQSPSDLEIAEKLFELGVLSEKPTGLTALNLILAWHKHNQSGATAQAAEQ